MSFCHLDVIDQRVPITERDIVAEIYRRLKEFYNNKKLSVHCEIKPAPNDNTKPEELRRLPRIDVGIITNTNGRAWISSAKKLQEQYKKGFIEARFSSIPIDFFHTAIEAKIQSNVKSAMKDIDTLKQINEVNKSCNCFFVLLNARGQKSDHESIKQYANRKGIYIVEYTFRYKHTKPIH